MIIPISEQEETFLKKFYFENRWFNFTWVNETDFLLASVLEQRGIIKYAMNNKTGDKLYYTTEFGEKVIDVLFRDLPI